MANSMELPSGIAIYPRGMGRLGLLRKSLCDCFRQAWGLCEDLIDVVATVQLIVCS